MVSTHLCIAILVPSFQSIYIYIYLPFGLNLEVCLEKLFMIFIAPFGFMCPFRAMYSLTK